MLRVLPSERQLGLQRQILISTIRTHTFRNKTDLHTSRTTASHRPYTVVMSCRPTQESRHD
jgi:hypothetical protein